MATAWRQYAGQPIFISFSTAFSRVIALSSSPESQTPLRAADCIQSASPCRTPRRTGSRPGQGAGMIERIKSVRPELQPHPLGQSHILAQAQIDVVHAVGADIAPAARVGLDVVGEVLVYAVADGVAGHRHVIVARHVLNTRPGREASQIGETDRTYDRSAPPSLCST